MSPEPPPSRDVRVVLVDDQVPFLTAAGAVVDHTPGFSVAGEARDGSEALAVAVGSAADLVLMDIRMPGIDGIEATRRIRAAGVATIVVLMSSYDRADLPDEVSTSGADAYVHKEELTPRVLAQLWEQHRPRARQLPG